MERNAAPVSLCQWWHLTEQDKPQWPAPGPTLTASTGARFKSTFNNISSLHFLPFTMSWERNKPGCLVRAVTERWPALESDLLAQLHGWVWLKALTVPGLHNSKKQVELHYKIFIRVMLEFLCSCLRLCFRGRQSLNCLRHFVLTVFSCDWELAEPEMLALSKYRTESNSMFCGAQSIIVC